MKRTIKVFCMLALAAITITSCITDNETIKSPECYISSFSIGDIKTVVTEHRTNAADTVVTKTVSGSSIRFNIDHINGIITSADSVATWCSLAKVCPSFGVVGTFYVKNESDGKYYSLTSGKDTISFEKPVEALVIATDGVSNKNYTIYINRIAADADTVIWSKKQSNIKVSDDFSTFVLNNTAYAFSSDNNGYMTLTTAQVSDSLISWSEPVTISEVQLDYSSVLIYNNEFYALGNDGYIYKAEQQDKPVNWKKVCEKTFDRLLASDVCYIYALSDGEILSSTDFNEWTASGKTDIDMLPQSCTQSFSYKTKFNSTIYTSMMCGVNSNITKSSAVWSKVTSSNKEINQNWMYVEQTGNKNIYPMPKFSNMSTILYNGTLIATGIEGSEGYKYLYFSEDNGISWHPQTSKYPIPEDLTASNGVAKMLCADGKVWIIQKDGNIWSGTIK